MLASFTAFSSDLLTSLDCNNKEIKNKAMLPYGHQVSRLLTRQTLVTYFVEHQRLRYNVYCVHYTLIIAPC